MKLQFMNKIYKKTKWSYPRIKNLLKINYVQQFSMIKMFMEVMKMVICHPGI